MRAIVLVPTYRERENIVPLLASIRQYAPGIHVLFIDDNSPDGTGAVAEELSRQHPGEVFVLHRPKKEGLGRAYVDAFREAVGGDYEFIIQMDADFSHDPKYLPSFFARANDCDLVIGSRYLKGISVVNWDLRRLILSKAATRYVQIITGMPYTDATGGFNLWRREALARIDFESTFSSGYMFLVEMKHRAFRAKLRVAEIPIIFVERRVGQSKLDVKILREAILGVVRLRLHRH